MRIRVLAWGGAGVETRRSAGPHRGPFLEIASMGLRDCVGRERVPMKRLRGDSASGWDPPPTYPNGAVAAQTQPSGQRLRQSSPRWLSVLATARPMDGDCRHLAASVGPREV